MRGRNVPLLGKEGLGVVDSKSPDHQPHLTSPFQGEESAKGIPQYYLIYCLDSRRSLSLA